MKKVVIIGGVAGGASCAARLRRLDETAQIVLLERGEYISYANCGLPYHVGDVIKARASLLLQTPEAMKSKFRVDVRVQNEVLSIDRANKTVLVKRVETGETYTEPYDTLVISTGSSPLRPPIPGIDSSRVQTLWTVPDTDRIRALVREQGVKSAAVIGGGFQASVVVAGGTVTGGVTASDLVEIQRGGCVQGDVQAKNVRICAGAKVVGDITAESNAMEAGAVVQGKLNVGEKKA